LRRRINICAAANAEDAVAMASRDRELARLIMLTGKVTQEHLSVDEIQAISSHLKTNVPQLQPVFAPPTITSSAIQDMVARCKVIELHRVSTNDMVNSHAPVHDDILFKRGKLANACCLILSGKVAVLAGKDEFYSELGAWSIVGSDAVKLPENTYQPDFSAYVASDSVRCLWITKGEVTDLIEGKPAGTRRPKRRSKPRTGSEEEAAAAAAGYGDLKPMNQPPPDPMRTRCSHVYFYHMSYTPRLL
jgi:hypothetical protein